MKRSFFHKDRPLIVLLLIAMIFCFTMQPGTAAEERSTFIDDTVQENGESESETSWNNVQENGVTDSEEPESRAPESEEPENSASESEESESSAPESEESECRVPESENLTEAIVEASSDQNSAGEGVSFISAVNGNTEVVITKHDGGYFPDGIDVQLFSVADMITDAPDIQAAYEEQEYVLKNAWEDTLADEYGSICVFLPYFVRVTDSSGNEIAADNVDVDFHIHNESMYENVLNGKVSSYIGRHDAGQEYKVLVDFGESTVMRRDEQKYLIFRMNTSEFGWFSILQTDLSEDESEIQTENEVLCNCGYPDAVNPLAHALECPVFEQELIALCDCGAKEASLFAHDYECTAVLQAMGALCDDTCDTGEEPWIWHYPGCPSYDRVLQALCSCDSDSPDVTEHEEGCEALEYAYEMQSFFFGDVAMYVASSPNGTPLTQMPSYKKVTAGSMSYSNQYVPLRKYSNSVITPWCTDYSNITEGTSTATGINYFIPKSANGKGKCGWTVTNVGYDRANKCFLDLKITLADYSTSCKTASGGTVANVYPHVGIMKNIGITWDSALPNFMLKYEIVKSGTNTLMAGNYRFQWRDIDSMQRFGLSLQNGKFDAKYCLTDAVPYGETHTYFGRSFECVNAVRGGSSDTDDRYSVWWELSGTSSFYIFVGQSGNRSESLYSASTIKDRYASSADGSRGGIAGLGWRASAPGPVVPLPDPVTKAVSNDGVNWGTSNTLASATSEYWYQIEAYVPFEDAAFYYNYFAVNDILPAGVDYAGSFSAVRVESGQDATDCFTVTNNNDNVTFAATAASLEQAAFYGYYYRFRFKVKMDPSEMAPAYNGNTAVYTVKNTATASARHKSDSSITSRTTNAVTTTASVNRITQAAPYKRLDSNEALISKKLGSVNDMITFSIYQTVPANSSPWNPGTITMTDVLQNCLNYSGCEVAFKPAGTQTYGTSGGWKVANSGQTVTVSRPYDASFAGGTLRFNISCRVKDGADLDGYYQKVEGVTWAVIPNTAKVRFDWTNGSPAAVEQTTNQVTVMVPVYRATLEVIKTNADTGETIGNVVFTVYEWKNSGYSIELGTLAFDAGSGKYRMDNITRSFSNQGKFKVVETTTPYGHIGTWEQEFQITEDAGRDQVFTYRSANPMAKGTITVNKKSLDKGEMLSGAEYKITAGKDIVSPQGSVLVKAGATVDTLETDADGKAVSKELYPGEYLVTETKAPPGYALDAVPQAVKVVYKDKATSLTNTDVVFVNDRLYACIDVTKEIDTEDIVWAHGNPTFTFKIAGTDVLGVDHTYYETVEFTPDETGTGKKTAITVRVKVLAGEYALTEEKTMRYTLDSIHSVIKGTASGNCVYFDVSQGETGAATFYNIKTTDEDLSHTSFVRNTIKG